MNSIVKHNSRESRNIRTLILIIKFLLKFDPEPQSVTCNKQVITQSLDGLWVTKRSEVRAKWKPLKTPNFHQIFDTTYNYLIYSFSNQIRTSQNQIEYSVLITKPIKRRFTRTYQE